MAENWKIEKGLCRCCHSEGSFHQLSELCTIGGEEGYYTDMLRLTLDITIEPVEEPRYSTIYNTICDDCILRVKDATAFKQQVRRCEARFLEMYAKGVIKVEAPPVIKQEPDTDDQKMDTDFGDMSDDNDASYNLESEPAMEVNIEICKEEPDVDLRRSVRTKKAAVRPQATENPKPKQKVIKKPRKIVKKIQPKPESSGDTKDEKDSGKDTIAPEAGIDYTEHSVNGKTTYSCNLCERSFTTGLYDLRKHILIRHFNKRLYKCNLCEESFKGIGPKRCHLLTSHGMEEIKIGNKNIIRAAVKVNCNVCNQELPSAHSLRQHMTYKHKVRQCPDCNMTFTSRRHVVLHKAEAHGIGMHSCGVCDFKHAIKAMIITHQRKVHLKEKNVTCPDCGLMFFGPIQLKNHMVRHNPVKKYECSFCHKRFPRQSTMREHEKIHLGDKRKVCQVCNERFVQTASLSYHMKKYHPEAC